MLPSSRFTEERCKFTEDRRNIKNPYIICHMMTSLDGSIDCAMSSKLPGVVDYYITLDAIRVPTTVSGRVTAELEMAEPGKFVPTDNVAYGQEGLLDEISILVGAGIDGRGGMPAVFDGLAMEHDVTALKLLDVQKFDSGTVWLRYSCK